jgi:hypothetical protein
MKYSWEKEGSARKKNRQTSSDILFIAVYDEILYKNRKNK